MSISCKNDDLKKANFPCQSEDKTKTSSPKGNDCSPESKQVFLNSSQESKRFFQVVKGS